MDSIFTSYKPSNLTSRDANWFKIDYKDPFDDIGPYYDRTESEDSDKDEKESTDTSTETTLSSEPALSTPQQDIFDPDRILKILDNSYAAKTRRTLENKPIDFQLDLQSRIREAYSYLSGLGFNKYAIAGLLGNFMGESGLNTAAENEGEKREFNNNVHGLGIAQWSNERVKLAEEFLGKPITLATLTELLQFMFHEIQNRPALLKALTNATSVELATDAVLRGYENGGYNVFISPEQFDSIYSKNKHNGNTYKDTLNKRLKYGNSIYKLLT